MPLDSTDTHNPLFSPLKLLAILLATAWKKGRRSPFARQAPRIHGARRLSRCLLGCLPNEPKNFDMQKQQGSAK